MRNNLYVRLWPVVFILIFTFLASVLSAQNEKSGPIPIWADTAINPHDFTDDYYLSNGINPKFIIGRRTGSDGLSVFGKSSNPYHTAVRIHVTLPTYNLNGEPSFWYPLGELKDDAFTDDEAGISARENAKRYPIYVFRDLTVKGRLSYIFAGTRHAPIMTDFWPSDAFFDVNPLGIREVLFVSYTEKAFQKEGVEMMNYFSKKNGLASDDTPIIKSGEDLTYLLENEFITADRGKPDQSLYAMSPVIIDPTKGAISKDAFVWMATKGGKPLPAEEIFAWHFGCLQGTGDWCK